MADTKVKGKGESLSWKNQKRRVEKKAKKMMTREKAERLKRIGLAK